ncbi:polysaccharide deacetylase family protein [Paenibacillus sp. FA6]|uniref:polysaccharide deacetylase family protein n=1 Tax=Paenibacillus sp. FA6 TaxID=3413029 RepID=UPI003F65CEF9
MFRKSILRFLFFLVLAGSLSIVSSHDVQAALSSTPIIPNPVSEPVVHSQNDHTSSKNSKEQQQKKSSATLSELYRKFPETMKTRGPRGKKIALTFDDVPDSRFTPAVLDILAKHHVKATFFIVGKRAKDHPDIVRRIQREGHAIGNHSYDHPQFTKISLEHFQSQINTTEQILNDLIHYKPRLIRPPYGEITEEQLKWAKKQGYKIINWNVDSLDWKGISKDEVKKNILSHVGPGSIILQHAGGGIGSDLTGTIEALPEIILNLRKKGYTFVTVPELLQISVEKIPTPK